MDENRDIKITSILDEKEDYTLEELRNLLLNSDTLVVDIDGTVKMVKEDNHIYICEKCGCEIDIRNLKLEEFTPCPKCAYPIWNSSHVIIPNFVGNYDRYKIEDKKGNNLVLDFNGKIRYFKSISEAEAYIRFKRWAEEEVEILGPF